MQRKESLIEVKVGALVLLAVAVLTGLSLILGDCSVTSGFPIYVDFTNAAGLKAGAPVRVSGIPVGTIRAVDYLGGEYDEEVGHHVYVRATLWVNESSQSAIRQDAEFSITTQSVLGEPYVEIASLNAESPEVEAGMTFQGIDPPRLDMILQQAYQSLEGVHHLVDRINGTSEEDEIRIDDFVNNIADLATHLDARVEANAEHFDGIIANVDTILLETRERVPTILNNVDEASSEFNQLGQSLNGAIGSGSSIRRTIRNFEEVSDVASREIEPLMTSARETAQTINQLIGNNEERVENVLANTEEITQSIVTASEDVEMLVTRIADGEGSIGRLLADEEIFEDIREFVREIKRRPWRVIWKE